jgi:hypothetical protein
MTTGERASIAASIAVLALLLAGGWFASGWRDETRAALRALAASQVSPAQTITAEWSNGDGVQRLTTYRDAGESFGQFLNRHRDCVRAAGGEK